MRMRKSIYGFFLLTISFAGLPLFSMDKTDKDKIESWYSKKIFIDPEFGAGQMVNLTFGLKIKNFYFGISGGFDIGSFQVLAKKYNEYLVNASGLLGYQVFHSSYFWTDVYMKAGYDMYFITGNYSSGGASLAPGIKIGFSGFFTDLCLPVTLGLDQPLYLFQLGVGWRLKFGRNK